MRASTALGLILCNLVWSGNAVAGKWVLADFAPGHAAFLRYALALVAFALAMLLRGQSPFFKPSSKREAGLALALGFFTFCFSPLLQLSGLHLSRATDNSLIIAMEPLITILLAWVILRERVRPRLLVCLTLALSGFFLLTGVSWGAGDSSSAWGNAIILLSLTGEAAYSVLGAWLVRTRPASRVFGTSLALGVLMLGTVVFATQGLPPLSAWTISSTAAVLWLGVFGTTITYLYWMRVLTEAPLSAMAISLFIQPLMGAVWGRVLLGELLTATQWMGGGLILAAVALQTYWISENLT